MAQERSYALRANRCWVIDVRTASGMKDRSEVMGMVLPQIKSGILAAGVDLRTVFVSRVGDPMSVWNLTLNNRR